MAILNDTNPFNKKDKLDELKALLDKYVPGAEALRTKLKKYDAAYKALTAENTALEKQLGSKESVLKKLEINEKLRELDELHRMVDGIPPEILQAAKQVGAHEACDPAYSSRGGQRALRGHAPRPCHTAPCAGKAPFWSHPAPTYAGHSPVYGRGAFSYTAFPSAEDRFSVQYPLPAQCPWANPVAFCQDAPNSKEFHANHEKSACIRSKPY